MIDKFIFLKEITDEKPEARVYYLKYGKNPDADIMIHVKIECKYYTQITENEKFRDLCELDEDIIKQLIDNPEFEVIESTNSDLIEGFFKASNNIYQSTYKFMGDLLIANPDNKNIVEKSVSEYVSVIYADYIPKDTYIVTVDNKDMLSIVGILVYNNHKDTNTSTTPTYKLDIVNPDLLKIVKIID